MLFLSDLSGPNAQMAVEILQQAGYKIESPVGLPMVPGMPMLHGGGAMTTERVNQHSSQTTGGINGVTL